jgi:hypothetical protein
LGQIAQNLQAISEQREKIKADEGLSEEEKTK